MHRTWALVGLAAIALSANAWAATIEAPRDVRPAGEARFAAPPCVEKSADGIKISFEASAATDVEVAVLDKAGVVVRHLAAGLLGPAAPAPLQAGSLRQELAWDGRDDLGRPVAADRGPFKARVRLGAKPKLDRIVGWDPAASSDFIASLAVNPQGELFVLMSNLTYGRCELRVMDREGKYLRTLLPYPADVPEERLESIGRLDVGGRKLPLVYDAHAHAVAPLTAGMARQSMLVHPKGHVVLASALGTIANHGPPRHLLAVHPQGGAPEGMRFVGPRFLAARGFLGGAGERGAASYDGLAVSPDGQWFYVTTSVETAGFAKSRQHCVWRVKWDDPTVGDPFLGKAEAGAGDAQFNDPQGVAVDSNGRIYVCDRGNNRVMIFSADGKLLGKADADQPQQIAVHPKTGEVLVVSRKPGQGHKLDGTALLKFSAFADGKLALAFRQELPKKAIEVFAIDPTASPTRLWVGQCPGWNRWEVVSAVEKAGQFEFGKSLFAGGGLSYPLFVHVDAARNAAYVSDWHDGVKRVDLASGATSRVLTRTLANEAVPAADGNLIVSRGWQLILARTDPSGKVLDFSPDVKQLGPWSMGAADSGDDAWARSKGPHVGDRGHVVAPNGDLYILVMSQYGPGRLDVYGPDGKLKKEGLIQNIPHGTSGLAVDPAGNVYLGVNVKPAEGEVFPHGFAGKLPTLDWVYWRRIQERKWPWQYPYFNTYLYHWGAVLKFSPKGGRFVFWTETGKNATTRPDVPAAATLYRSGYLNYWIAVEGAEWRYPGCGPVPTMGLNWGDPSCTCNNSRLDADAFGRLFVPDVFRFSVQMLDAAGNQIAQIGQYGNADSGPGSRLAEPAIPFAWPAFVDAADGRLYVSDSVNRRVVVVAFDWSAEAVAGPP